MKRSGHTCIVVRWVDGNPHGNEKFIEQKDEISQYSELQAVASAAAVSYYMEVFARPRID